MLECGCEENAGNMGTMLRIGREGYGHYAQDGDYMGVCNGGKYVHPTAHVEPLDITDAQLVVFINDVDWYLGDNGTLSDGFFEAARVIAEELQAWRKLDASTNR